MRAWKYDNFGGVIKRVKLVGAWRVEQHTMTPATVLAIDLFDIL